MTRPEVYSITGNSQADLLENGMDSSNKLAWGEPTPSNIAVFETLSKGGINVDLIIQATHQGDSNDIAFTVWIYNNYNALVTLL